MNCVTTYLCAMPEDMVVEVRVVAGSDSSLQSKSNTRMLCIAAGVDSCCCLEEIHHALEIEKKSCGILWKESKYCCEINQIRNRHS